MADIRQQRPCRLYSVGDCVQHIRERKACDVLEPAIVGRLVTARRRLVTFEVEGRALHRWNHFRSRAPFLEWPIRRSLKHAIPRLPE